MPVDALDVQLEEEALLLNGEPWLPKVLDGQGDPAEFNTGLVRLPAGAQSDLNWLAALDLAREWQARGWKLLWELDLGLFSELKEPLSDQAQFQALAFALQHFAREVWPEFAGASVGACIYRGTGDFTSSFHWTAEQEGLYAEWRGDFGDVGHARLFCRDACVHFMELLAARLPDECQAFVMLDLSLIDCPWERLLIQSRDQYPYLHRILYPYQKGEVALAWREGSSRWGTVGGLGGQDEPEATLGLCLPGLKEALKLPERLWRPVLEQLEAEGRPFRIVPESELVTSWQGLDQLLVFREAISPQGKRMLQGFEAAGGEVLYR